MPVIIAAAAVSALMQYYNSEKARGAAKEQLAKIETMFNNIKPPGYDIHVWDDPKVAQDIPAPAFNNVDIKPEDYKAVGQYVPEIQNFVKETNPQLLKLSDAGQQGQQAQLSALDKYRQIAASGGQDPQFLLAQQQAADAAQGQAQSRNASTLQNAQRRGQLDSGLMQAAQLQGNSDSMQRGAMMSQQAAADAYRNKMQALASQASLGGQVQQNDMAFQGKNTDIINDFNQRTTAQYQNYLTQKAQMANQAQIQNLNAQQQISNANVQQNNQANQYNQGRQNQLASQNWDIQQANRQNAINMVKQKQGNQQQNFDNSMSQASGKAGLGYQQINMGNQAAQDQNQALGGLANTATNAYMYKNYMDKRYPENNPAAQPAQSPGGNYQYQSQDDLDKKYPFAANQSYAGGQ